MKNDLISFVRKYFKLTYISIFLSVAAIILGTVFFGLYASGEGKASVQSMLPNFVTQNVVKIRDNLKDLKYIVRRFPESNLPVYELNLSKENLKKLDASIPDLEARKELPGYADGIDDRIGDENRVYVPAKFVFAGKEYDVEVRFRGNGPPHWTFPKKSLRVRFPKDDLFNGKRDINLIIPLDRRYLAEEFNNYRAEKMGLIVPDSQFVAVKINGDTSALYWEVEHFTKEFVESHGLSGDANLYGEGDTFQQPLYTEENYWQKYVADPNKKKEEYSELNLLLSLLNDAPDEVFYKHIFDILDEDNFYAWSIHNLLAGSWHQDYSHNARIYFDKSRGKFIFLPWDVYIYDNEDTTSKLDYALEGTANPLVDRLFSADSIMHKRNGVLWEYVKDNDNLKRDLKHYDELFVSIQKVFYKDPIRRHSYAFFEGEINATRNDIEKNFNQIKYLFENSEASFILENNNENDLLQLEVATFRTFAPVYIEKVTIQFAKDKELKVFDIYKDNQLLCSANTAEIDEDKREVSVFCDKYNLLPKIVKFNKDSERENPYSFNIFRAQKEKYNFIIMPKEKIKLTDIENFAVKVINSYTDKKVKEIMGVFVDNTEFANFADISYTPQEFVSSNPRFYLNSAKEIVLPSGLYIFSENIVIPRNTKLIILPGAQINLTNDASFISYSPVEAIGAETNKIYVRGESDGLGENFGVLDNKGLSKFEYVEFSGGGESTVNGAFFSGMLAIHHADSIVKHSIFRDAQGDDALNIKYASSTISYNLFADNSADAIDYDFSGGTIEHNKFIDNGNDGIDTSGSDVLIQYNYIATSGDKCMSIGEKSTSVIFNNVLNNCLIGIEVKDLSTPIIINNVIVNNDIGINEYQKKPIFGGGMGKVYNTIIWDNKESVTLDDVSRIEIINSSVEGDYDGEGNFAQKPIFNEDFTNNRENANIKFQNGGNREIIKEFLGLNLLEVPVGLVKEFASGL